MTVVRPAPRHQPSGRRSRVLNVARGVGFAPRAPLTQPLDDRVEREGREHHHARGEHDEPVEGALCGAERIGKDEKDAPRHNTKNSELDLKKS